MTELPKVGYTHTKERKSIKQLANILPDELFILRSEDGGDYGVDRIIEVIENWEATNIRCHIQIKSTTKNSKNEKLNYSVPIKTINYLLNSLNSIFIVYSESENKYYWEWVGRISTKKNQSNSKGKKTFSYYFSSILDIESFKKIHTRLISDSEFVKKINLSASPYKKVILTEKIHESSYREYLIMYAEGKYEKIIAISKEIEKITPTLNSLISLCYYSIYNYDEALNHILKAEQEEKNSEFQKIKAAILCEKGLAENNTEILEQAKKIFLEIKSNDWGWMDLYNYGNILSGLAEFEQAEDCYKNAIQLEENEAIVWKNLSSIYYHKNDYEKEMDCLNKALEIDENLIEALICKGISLGNNYSEYLEAITCLRKALELSRKNLYKNNSVYYWLSYFLNQSKQYKESLIMIEEGLKYHPGDRNLDGLRVKTLIIASESLKEYENIVITELDRIIDKYPDNIWALKEKIKILGRQKSLHEIFPLIKKCFLLYNYDIDIEIIMDLTLNQIMYILDNINIVSEYRKNNNIGSYFFESYNIGISIMQKIEMKMNLKFIAFFYLLNDLDENAVFPVMEDHAKAILDLIENITEFLVYDLIDGSIDEKSERITHIITTLPEILLIELSRQNGWNLVKHNFKIEIADYFIENSLIIHNWLNNCLEPILKGANNIFKWDKK